MTPDQCPCGSGEPCWALKDGYGIFMTYACDCCVAAKLGQFRDDIFDRYDTDEQVEED